VATRTRLLRGSFLRFPWPEAELVLVDVERINGCAPDPGIRALPAAHDALRSQKQVRVEHHALFSQLVPQPVPVTGESGTGSDVAPSSGRNIDRLRTALELSQSAVRAQQDH
jgi:hypothetical protein